MTSAIDATLPIQGRPTTASVRANFATAKSEIEALQTQATGIVNVLSYGAVGDGTTDDTAAIQAALDAVVAAGGGTLQLRAGTYLCNSALSVADASINIVGEGQAQTFLKFPASNGIVFVCDASNNLGCSVSGVCFMSGADGVYTGLKYTGALEGAGGANSLVDLAVTDCAFVGSDRITGTSTTNSWLKAVDLIDVDNAIIRDVYIAAGESAFSGGWSEATVGISADDCTILNVNSTSIYWCQTGVSITGASEGSNFNQCNVVANRYGMVVNTDSPGNQHSIIGGHFSSYDRDLNIQNTGTNTVANVVSGCFFLQRPGSTATGYENIRLECLGGSITGNMFMLADAGIDPVAKSNVSIKVLSGSDSIIIANNVFYRQATCVQIDSGASRTVFMGNTTRDDATTLSATYADDSGTATNILWNIGDRIGTPQYRIQTPGVADFEAGSYLFKTGVNKNTCLSVTPGNVSAVNYVDIVNAATNNAVIVRALGSDTNIDLQILPKGSGKVKFGIHSVVVAETVTGYITINDAAGNPRKLAVVS